MYTIARGYAHLPAPSHNSAIEVAVGATSTRHPHHQRQTKQLMIAVGLVCVFHITHSVKWAHCTGMIYLYIYVHTDWKCL